MRFMSREQNLIRCYLLGTLDERQQQRIEERVLTDRRFRRRVLLVEDELFDDYVLGTLSSDERRRFDERLLATAEQVNKLENLKALKDYATSVAAGLPRGLSGRSSLASRWLGALVSKRNLIYLPAAAVALIILVSLVVFVVQRQSKPGRDARAERAVLEEQIARLNERGDNGGASSGRPAPDPASVLSVALAPTAVRGAEQSSMVTVPADKDLLQFELQMLGGEQQSFEATLQTPEGPEIFTVRGLRAGDWRGGKAVSLLVPARQLPGGDYILTLRGASRDRQTSVVGEYYFRILRAGHEGQ